MEKKEMVEVELVPFTKEDADKILLEIDGVLKKYEAEIVVKPEITKYGTLGAFAQIFKKKNKGVLTDPEFLPEQNGGEKGGTETSQKVD